MSKEPSKSILRAPGSTNGQKKTLIFASPTKDNSPKVRKENFSKYTCACHLCTKKSMDLSSLYSSSPPLSPSFHSFFSSSTPSSSSYYPNPEYQGYQFSAAQYSYRTSSPFLFFSFLKSRKLIRD